MWVLDSWFFDRILQLRKLCCYTAGSSWYFLITGHGLTWTGSLVSMCSDIAQVMCCKNCPCNKQFRQWWSERGRRRSWSGSSYFHVESHHRHECSWWISPQTPVRSALEIALHQQIIFDGRIMIFDFLLVSVLYFQQFFPSQFVILYILWWMLLP